jgi:hypothetical protein
MCDIGHYWEDAPDWYPVSRQAHLFSWPKGRSSSHNIIDSIAQFHVYVNTPYLYWSLQSSSSFNLHSESTGAKGNPLFLPLLMGILVKMGYTWQIKPLCYNSIGHPVSSLYLLFYLVSGGIGIQSTVQKSKIKMQNDKSKFK